MKFGIESLYFNVPPQDRGPKVKSSSENNNQGKRELEIRIFIFLRKKNSDLKNRFIGCAIRAQACNYNPIETCVKTSNLKSCI